MKKYPCFERGQLKKIFEKLPPKERAMIEEYAKYRSINITSKPKLEDTKRHIVQTRYITQKPLDFFTLKDLRDFLALLNASGRELSGKDDVKITLKNFLKWKFKNWSERFEGLKDIRTANRERQFNHKKINASTLLTKEELERMMKYETRLYWKAFLIVLWESGLRPLEVRRLKWEDIEFNSEGEVSELNVFATKTQRSRVVYVKEATYYLKRLQEESKEKSVFCFPSPFDNNKIISKFTVSNWIRKLSKKSIGRSIFCYILRHSRATELYKLASENKISKDVASLHMGHSKDMSKIYTHLNKTQIKEMMIKAVYNLEEMPPKERHELEERIKDLEEKNEQIFKALCEIVQEKDNQTKEVKKDPLIKILSPQNAN